MNALILTAASIGLSVTAISPRTLFGGQAESASLLLLGVGLLALSSMTRRARRGRSRSVESGYQLANKAPLTQN
jgi:hypothetical protein